MNELTTPSPMVRNSDQAEQLWFSGGGLHTWLAKEEETGGAFLLYEDRMDAGKVTPLHTHPVDESLYVLEGTILVHLDGEESTVETGGLAFAPSGVPHAFMVTSPVARLLTLHVPGGCQAFYLGASDAVPAQGPASCIVDFDKVMASAREHGGIEIIGPPPFGRG